MTRQFAPGDRLLIEAVATDVTAARLNLGQRAEASFGREDVVTAPTSAAEVRAMLADVLKEAVYAEQDNGLDFHVICEMAAGAAVAHPVLGPRLLGQQGGDAGEAVWGRLDGTRCTYCNGFKPGTFASEENKICEGHEPGCPFLAAATASSTSVGTGEAS